MLHKEHLTQNDKEYINEACEKGNYFNG